MYAILLSFLLLDASRYVANGFKLEQEGKIHVGRRIELPKEKTIFEINKGVSNLIHGDVLPGKNPRAASDPRPVLWPNAKIPFEYTSNLSSSARAAAELARIEYKMRTCIEFVPRQNEDAYVVFKSLDGCYSYVGVIGGPQILSLGIGCEQMSTAIHEMMHASGSWHEQSRADRDNYIEILWENIEPDQMHAFDSYNFLQSNPQKLPYNYNSIMHYNAYAFSTNDKQTIRTYDPKFTTVVGQRKTFSIEDTTKLNRLYECNEPLLDSYNCNFEEDSACGYTYMTPNSIFTWIQHNLASKVIPVNSPQTDATYGENNKGRYMIANVGDDLNTPLTLNSSRLTSKSGVQCFQFSYYIKSQAESPLTIKIGQTSEESSENVAVSDTFINVDDSAGKWIIMRQTISVPSSYRLIFTASEDLTSSDVVGLDDVSVQNEPCDTGFFMIEEYSSYSQGEPFYSPIMYTADGYAFQFLIYPAGHSKNPDHIGVYFALVEGANDSVLQWPYCDRIIKTSLVDQTLDPLYAMDYYFTSQPTCSYPANLHLWEKPGNSALSSFRGYAEFYPISDLTGAYQYLKHDSLVFSTLVIDVTDTYVDPTIPSFQEDTTSGQTVHSPELLLFLFIAIFNFWLHRG